MRFRVWRRSALVGLLLLVPFAAGPMLHGAAGLAYKGMSYAGWRAGCYATPSSDLSLSHIAETGADWISLVVTTYQDDLASTTISPTEATPTDDELVRALDAAHALGLKVMLKPHLDLWRDPDHWRGEIGSAFGTEDQWRAWFASYRAQLEHYAGLAESRGADMFCVGTELEGTSGREADWRAVIAAVRARYHGPLIYAANHGGEETRLAWWDAVDLIGVDAYYALAEHPDPTLDKLAEAWSSPRERLAGLASRWGKSIVFTEIGYRSIPGTASHPWDWQVEGQADVEEQADAYRAAYEAFAGQSWFGGFFWWSWGTDPFEGGPCDTGYSPHDKPAEGLLRTWYGAARPWRPEIIPAADRSRAVTIYGDGLGPGWEDRSWGADIDLRSTERSAGGACSISVRFEPWGSLSFDRTAFLPDPGLRLVELAVFIPEGEPPALWISLYDQDGNELGRRPLEDCRYLAEGRLVPGTWNWVRIPLRHLGADGKFLTRVCFEDRSGSGSSRFWMDEIALTAARRPDRQGRDRPPLDETIKRR
jgi:hypothetical protein